MDTSKENVSITENSMKKQKTCSEEMARCLRALVALLEDHGLDSQHLHGASQLSVTSVTAYLMPSSVLHGHCRHVTHAIKIHTHIHLKKIKIQNGHIDIYRLSFFFLALPQF